MTGMDKYEAQKEKCKSCRKYGGCDGLHRMHCLVNDNEFFAAFTNADRIRIMSNEELAEWLATAIARHYNQDAVVTSMDSVLWLEWLKEVSK